MFARLPRQFAFAALFAAHCVGAGPALAEVVGRTSALVPTATQQTGGAPATLNLNDAVLRNAVLETAKGGALEVTFADNSKLSLGEGSQAVIDEFTYAGPGSPGSQSMKLTKGLFRFVSGAVPKDKVKLETPAVTIGIRGTTLRIKAPGDGTTTVGVDDDGTHPPDKTIAIATSKISGISVALKPGQYVTFGPDGTPGPIQQGTVPGCN
jgi:ferric-dicitrate binding protein FerR (iron transport regulator)